MGVGDSKKLSDKRRRELIAPISDVVLAAVCKAVPPEDTFDPGQKPSWRSAVVACALGVVRVLPAHDHDIRIVIDGNRDEKTRLRLRAGTGIHKVRFQKGADDSVYTVSAASIIAKTIRNDLMLELHEEYPEYGWNTNYGYGSSKKHKKAIEEFGISRHHRCIKSLADVPIRSD